MNSAIYTSTLSPGHAGFMQYAGWLYPKESIGATHQTNKLKPRSQRPQRRCMRNKLLSACVPRSPPGSVSTTGPGHAGQPFSPPTIRLKSTRTDCKERKGTCTSSRPEFSTQKSLDKRNEGQNQEKRLELTSEFNKVEKNSTNRLYLCTPTVERPVFEMRALSFLQLTQKGVSQVGPEQWPCTRSTRVRSPASRMVGSPSTARNDC